MRDQSDDEFRSQVEQAAEFMSAMYLFKNEEFLKYLEQYKDLGKLQDTLVGMQAILGFALVQIAKLKGTFKNDLSASVLEQLRYIMLDFNRYDSSEK